MSWTPTCKRSTVQTGSHSGSSYLAKIVAFWLSGILNDGPAGCVPLHKADDPHTAKLARSIRFLRGHSRPMEDDDVTGAGVSCWYLFELTYCNPITVRRGSVMC